LLTYHPSMLSLRVFATSALAALVVTGCGLLPGIASDDECDPKPVEEWGTSSWLAPAVASATLCTGVIVRVDGRDYGPWGGGWLNEEALILHEHGRITHSHIPVGEPVAYELEGVPAERILIMKTVPSGTVGSEDGTYTVLRAGSGPVPPRLCDYADPGDSQYPVTDCPIPQGGQYSASIIPLCHLRRLVGPYGGTYWRVLDPPDHLPEVGMQWGRTDHGTIELLPNGRLRYVAEKGAVIELEMIDDPGIGERGCSDH
jgi:hypothetical protein